MLSSGALFSSNNLIILIRTPRKPSNEMKVRPQLKQHACWSQTKANWELLSSKSVWIWNNITVKRTHADIVYFSITVGKQSCPTHIRNTLIKHYLQIPNLHFSDCEWAIHKEFLQHWSSAAFWWPLRKLTARWSVMSTYDEVNALAYPALPCSSIPYSNRPSHYRGFTKYQHV